MKHDGISVACSILPDVSFGLGLIVIHVAPGVALNLSALLHKNSIAPACFLGRLAGFAVASGATTRTRDLRIDPVQIGRLSFAAGHDGTITRAALH
jgi:hypothetical protein